MKVLKLNRWVASLSQLVLWVLCGSAIAGVVPRTQWSTLDALNPAVGVYVLDQSSESPAGRCAPYLQFAIRPDAQSATFVNREFWYQPGLAKSSALDVFQNVNGQPYNIDRTWNVPTPGFWIQTTLKNGRLLTKATRETVLRGGKHFKSAQFSQDAPGSRLQAELRGSEVGVSCHYSWYLESEFVAMGEKRIDLVTEDFSLAQTTLNAMSDLELSELCTQIRTRDKYFSGSGSGAGFCVGTATEIRTQIAGELALTLKYLGLERLGLKDPVQAYGPVVASDRLYRVSDNRAVFGGFDPVMLHDAEIRAFTGTDRCEGQNLAPQSCRLSGLFYAAYLTRYHSE